MVHEVCGAVDQASAAHAQCGLPVQSAGGVDISRQRQTNIGHARVLLSVLSQDVAQILRDSQSAMMRSVTSRAAAEIMETFYYLCLPFWLWLPIHFTIHF